MDIQEAKEINGLKCQARGCDKCTARRGGDTYKGKPARYGNREETNAEERSSRVSVHPDVALTGPQGIDCENRGGGSPKSHRRASSGTSAVESGRGAGARPSERQLQREVRAGGHRGSSFPPP